MFWDTVAWIILIVFALGIVFLIGCGLIYSRETRSFIIASFIVLALFAAFSWAIYQLFPGFWGP